MCFVVVVLFTEGFEEQENKLHEQLIRPGMTQHILETKLPPKTATATITAVNILNSTASLVYLSCATFYKTMLHFQGTLQHTLLYFLSYQRLKQITRAFFFVVNGRDEVLRLYPSSATPSATRLRMKVFVDSNCRPVHD